MKIENPKVTLRDDARKGVKEEVRSGFLDWLYQFSVEGDDGELYAIGGSILSMNVEKLDLVSMTLAKGKGCATQLRNSVYKVARFPGAVLEKLYRNPAGTLKIEEREHSILVSCGPEYSVECFEDNSWHLLVTSREGEYTADLWHRPAGYPLWYGRESPSALTQYSITYGYNCAAPVEGSFTLNGKTVKVKGLGIRERYVAVDSSAAELGGWEDWGFISFNEVHSSMYDMRLGMKDFSILDLATGKHYTTEGHTKGGDNDNTEMETIHEDWAFLRELDGFIPMTYRYIFRLEDGCRYEIEAKAVNATCWGATHKVPDNPVATLTFGEVNGRFIYPDGTVKELTGGKGCLSIRQWHAYPNILPRELYTDNAAEIHSESKFDTL